MHLLHKEVKVSDLRVAILKTMHGLPPASFDGYVGVLVDVLEERGLALVVQRAVLAVLERLPAHWTDPYTRTLLKAYKTGVREAQLVSLRHQHKCDEEREDKEEDRCQAGCDGGKSCRKRPNEHRVQEIDDFYVDERA